MSKFSLIRGILYPVSSSGDLMKHAVTLSKLVDFLLWQHWDDSSHWEEINNFAEWCKENHLQLNGTKIEELIAADKRTDNRVYISGAEVEQVNSYRFLDMFLGITIPENLSWSPPCFKRSTEKAPLPGETWKG